jgi:hypothetical protein
MTVRGNIDQLMAEPAVADLGYPADQRLVATVVLGLKMLAEAIDDIEARLAITPPPFEGPKTTVVPAEMRDITSEIHDITEQVGKLAKIVKKAAKAK